MKKILLLSVHPQLNTASRANFSLASHAAKRENLLLHDLSALYPSFEIDVEQEQSLILQHDVIALQSPFYWYSHPPIFKQWQDQVLSYGFAYGGTGDKLKGKKFFLSLTTGGAADYYQRDGLNHFTFDELLAPLQATINLCGMEWIDPLILSSVPNIPGIEQTDTQANAIENHKSKLDRILDQLSA